MSGVKFFPARPEDFDSDTRTSLVHSSIPLFEAYIGLKSLFGDADRTNLDPTKQEWMFYLQTDGSLIETYDWKRTMFNIGVYEQNNDSARAELLVQELEQQILDASRRQSSQIEKLRKAPVGYVIQNPFAFYLRTAEELIGLAEMAESQHEPTGALCQAAFYQLLVAAEGFLNLIYELYLKPELRDDRIAGKLARDQIDMKLRLAPIYCDGFAGRPFDHRTEAFRNFQKLFRIRNDFVHANVTKGMKHPIVEYDEIDFILWQEEGNDDLPSPSQDLGMDEVKRVLPMINAIVEQVLASMEPRHRRDLQFALHDDLIHVRDENGTLVIIYDD
jgi:hypothetical protein